MSTGGGGGGTTTTNTIQRADPWSGQTPYLRDVFAEAQRLYWGANPQTVNGVQVPDPSATPQYFPGAAVAPFSPETEQALGLEAARARAGSPLLMGAQGEAARTLGGAYLSADNPYLAAMMNRIDNTIRPRVDSRFEAAGRYGSPAHAETTARALADAAADLAYRNYADERQNQLRAVALAPGLAAQDYADIARLREAGSQREALSQAQLADEVARWNFNQNRDAARLAQYLQMVQGNYGGTTSGSETQTLSRDLGVSPLMNAVTDASQLAGTLGLLGDSGLGLLGAPFALPAAIGLLGLL